MGRADKLMGNLAAAAERQKQIWKEKKMLPPNYNLENLLPQKRSTRTIEASVQW